MTMNTTTLAIVVAVVCTFSFSACSKQNDAAPSPSNEQAQGSEQGTADPAVISPPESAASELAGTAWELVKIQSMDDTEWVPEDSSRYTLVLEADGNAYMQLDCNRGKAGWVSEESGSISFTLVASTNALCQDDGLAERYAAQFEFVRSYVLRSSHLFLATMADGAIIEFKPVERVQE